MTHGGISLDEVVVPFIIARDGVIIMAKMVGLSRKLKLPWLKYTVDLVADGTAESEIKKISSMSI